MGKLILGRGRDPLIRTPKPKPPSHGKAGRKCVPVPGLPDDYNGPGVYVLVGPDGSIYVGSSMNVRKRLTDQRVKEHRGWAQRVIKHGADITKQELTVLEAKAIVRLAAHGRTLTNHMFNPCRTRKPKNPKPPLTCLPDGLHTISSTTEDE